MRNCIVIVGDVNKSIQLTDYIELNFELIFINLTEDRLNPEDCRFKLLKYKNNIEEISINIRLISNNVVKIIPNAEIGVELCDELNNIFCLYWNDYSKKATRRDKFAMQVALKNNSLNHIKSFIGNEVSEVILRVESSLSYPIIIKPVKSAASDNVFICANKNELMEKFEIIIGTNDIFENLNSHVLVQEFINGVEYVVDTMSCSSEAIVCAVWRYEKIHIKRWEYSIQVNGARAS